MSLLKSQLIFAGVIAATPTLLMAQTATTSFDVTITIEKGCTVDTTGALNFGIHGVLDVDKTAQTTISVICTNTTPYTISLDEGDTSGATTLTRRMRGTGANTSTVAYNLYRDTGRTLNWGNNLSAPPGIDVVDDTGNGNVQPHIVYGKVPPQTTPQPDTYSDNIAVTVTY